MQVHTLSRWCDSPPLTPWRVAVLLAGPGCPLGASWRALGGPGDGPGGSRRARTGPEEPRAAGHEGGAINQGDASVFAPPPPRRPRPHRCARGARRLGARRSLRAHCERIARALRAHCERVWVRTGSVLGALWGRSGGVLGAFRERLGSSLRAF